MPLSLSVLDQAPISSGRTPGDAVRETLALARHCDALGFRRYWLAEHHSSGSLSCAAPEVLMSAIASTTPRIRVGSAGVMLPHYSSLKVAEQFRMLEALAPGRIDLGVGRAPGSDGRTALALNPQAREAAERFPQQVQELLGWLGEGLPEQHPFRSVTAQPAVATTPELWVLGSSDYGAQVAAYFGLPYCFAHFITDGRGSEDAMALYRERFVPHGERPGDQHEEPSGDQPGNRPARLAAPHGALGVFALAAETEAEAWRLFGSRALWRLSRDRGIYPPLPSLAEAEGYPYSDAERSHVERLRARAIVGTGAQVREKLEALAAAHGVEEIAVLTAVHDPAARQRSYALLADAFGMVSAAAAAE